jgi:hypothetical protein
MVSCSHFLVLDTKCLKPVNAESSPIPEPFKVCSRLTENFYKPSIVLKEETDKYVASCRSPEYFSIVDLLEEFKDEFIAFG